MFEAIGPNEANPAAATIRKCSSGKHSWSVPFIGPDLGAIGFADIAGGKQLCCRCLVEYGLSQNISTVEP
jgi:hypothetical protein